MLSLYKLEIFSLVAQAGSFSRAADSLYMSQSAVSQHIQTLETRLGTRLFERGPRGVTLTSAGETLYGYTQRILHLVAEAEHLVTNVDNLIEGQARIGATPGIDVYLLPPWIEQFRQRYPRLSLTLQSSVTREIVEGVLEQKLEIGFVEGELNNYMSSRLRFLVFQAVEMLVVVGRKHPWWGEPEISIEMLSEKTFIMRQQNSQTRIWLDELIENHEIAINVAAEFDNPESIKHAVMASEISATILPDYAVNREIDSGTMYAIRLKDVTLQRQLKLIWNNDLPLSPIVRAFLRILQEDKPQLAPLTR